MVDSVYWASLCVDHSEVPDMSANVVVLELPFALGIC